MTTIVIVIIGIILLVAFMNQRENRIGASTRNPQQTVELYKKSPHLRVPLLQMADGNTEALAVLERLAILSFRYNHVNLDRLIELNISGYKIVLLYRSVGKDIMKLAAATASNTELNRLLVHVEAVKYDTLPAFNPTSMKVTLKQFDIEDVDELLEPSNARAWRSTLNWKFLLTTTGELTRNFDHVLFDFLIPDQIDCSTWLINYLSLSDYSSAMDLDEFLTPEIRQLAESNFTFDLTAYPKWFQAAYPSVVTWISNPNTGELQEKLSEETYRLLEDEASEMEMGQQFSPYLLREVYNDYAESVG